MGLPPEEFDRLTPAQFIYAYLGWRKLQQDKVRHDWELCRYQTWVLTSIQLDRKDRLPLQQMFPMPWDGSATRGNDKENSSEKVNELTMEERLARVREMLK